MENNASLPNEIRFILSAACFVVIIAGFRAAAGILVPFLLAVFIAIIFTPPLFWMQRKRVPSSIAILIIIFIMLFIGFLLLSFVGGSLNDFTRDLPLYQNRLLNKSSEMIAWLRQRGFVISESMVLEYFDPGMAMQMAARTLTGLSGVLTNIFLILLTVIFILLEASGMPGKIRAAATDPEKSLHDFGRFTKSVNRYLALKTLFSLITGLLVLLWLTVIGVDYAMLWALLAFLLNYIPNIGSIIAAAPAILVALVQLGPWPSVATGIGYLAINMTVGSIIEPRILGSGMGLSALVVFLSLVFWGWVLGPVGMLLSVPLTMVFKIALESNTDTRWLAIMLGNETLENPPEWPVSFN